MRSRSLLRVLAALAALSLLVAACGSDDSETSTAADAGIPATDDSPDSDTEDGDSDGDDVAESGLSDDDAGDEATSEVIDPAGSDDFCSLYIQNQDLVNEFDFFDPVQVEQWIGTSVGLLDQAIATAPDEIVADLQTIRADFDTVVGVLEDAEYDFLAAAEAMDAIERPEADAASERLDAYVESVCGVDPDQASEDFADNAIAENLDSLLENDAVLAAMIEGMTEDGTLTEEEAVCLLQNFDPELLAGFAADGGAAALSDPAALQDLLGVLETCGIDITQLAG